MKTKIKFQTIAETIKNPVPFIDPADLAAGNRIQFIVSDDILFESGETFTVVDHPTDWQVLVKSELTGEKHKLGMNGMKGMVRL